MSALLVLFWDWNKTLHIKRLTHGKYRVNDNYVYSSFWYFLMLKCSIEIKIWKTWDLPNAFSLLKNFFKRRFYLFILERNGRRKRGKETSVCGCLLRTPLMGDLACNPGTWLQTGNPTGDYLVCRPVLSPLSHANQGHNCLLELNLVAPLASRSQ